MVSVMQDVRYAVRNLARDRGFATTTIVTLALGIGANTAIFSLLNPLVFRPLAVADPQHLSRVFSGRTDGNRYGRFSYPNYVAARQSVKSFSALAAYSWPVPLGLRADRGLVATSHTERVWGAFVTANYFSTLRVAAAMGRTLLPEGDEVPNRPPVVVISHRLWTAKFGATPDIVGRSVNLNGQAFTVIGVAPQDAPQLEPFFPVDIWVPIMAHRAAMPEQEDKLASRAQTWLSVIGRLRPEATLAAANGELGAVARRLEQAYPDDNRRLVFSALSEKEGRALMLPGVAPAGWGLLAMVGLVLLIACTNIVSLALARSLKRRKEFAIRLSIGAGRWRVVQQLLTESLMISMLGGAAGILVAVNGTQQLLRFIPPLPINVRVDAEVDIRVLLFTALISVLTGLVIGLLPAWQATQLDLVSSLTTRDANVGSRPRRFITRDTLVVGQIAVSVLLLIGAGLFIRSLQNASRTDLGFERDNRLLAAIDLAPARYTEEEGRQFQVRLLRELNSLPGVVSASATAHAPLGPGYLGDGKVYIEAAPSVPDEQRPVVFFDKVGPRHFHTIGAPLMLGRDFTEQDRIDAPLVAIVNQTFARAFWSGQSAIGKRFALASNSPLLEVVGVVADGKYHRLGEQPQRHLYLPLLQGYQPSMTLVLHTVGDRSRVSQSLRSTVQRLNPDLAVTDVRTMHEHLGFALFPARAGAALLSGAGLLGLGLTMVGLYGLLAFVVRQRTREMGIRMALGAGRGDVIRLVLRRSLVICGWGIGLGCGVAWIASMVLARVLYGVNPHDATVFAGAPLVLLVVAVAATVPPVLAAVRVDPMTALRQE
jgi:macrolide transport system ATP-binding/permease protein